MQRVALIFGGGALQAFFSPASIKIPRLLRREEKRLKIKSGAGCDATAAGETGGRQHQELGATPTRTLLTVGFLLLKAPFAEGGGGKKKYIETSFFQQRPIFKFSGGCRGWIKTLRVFFLDKSERRESAGDACCAKGTYSKSVLS